MTGRTNDDSPPALKNLKRVLYTVVFLSSLVIAAFAVPAGAGGRLITGGPFSLIPPLVAIGIAVIWRQIHLAILMGILGGALLLVDGNPILALTDTAVEFVGPTMLEPGNLYLFAFTLCLMGMVGVIIRNGGIEGVVRSLAGLASGRRSTQAVVAAMGTAVFFDDYANAVVVGSSARALTDRVKISREKLAYLVDSTAAPIASVAIISTWIGIEIGLLDKQLDHLSTIAPTGYGVFIHLIPYRFYCLFTLAMVFAVALTGRDFGPMLRAERRARTGQLMHPDARPLTAESFRKLRPKEGVTARAVNGFGPVLVVLGAILFSFFFFGARAPAMAGREVSLVSLTSWRNCFCSVENTGLLLTSAGILGSVVAIALSLAQKLLSFREALRAWLAGARSMLGAIALLIVAMSLRKVTDADHLALADYVLSLMADTASVWIPVSIFVAAGMIAFSTGTSYGTMGILIPVAVPLAARAGDPVILILATGAVLDGAVFGDHCSPISDTTVLSSIGSSCDHLDHVRTQAPYALTSMLVAAGLGYLLLPLSSITLSLVYLTGIICLFGTVWLLGKRPELQGETT